MLIESADSRVTTSGTFSLEVKYSPNIEMAASLFALSSDRPSDGMAWMGDAKDLIARERGEQFSRLSNLTVQWTLVMDLFEYIELTNITDVTRFLSELADLDLTEFSYGLLSGLVPRDEIERVSGRPEVLESWHCERFEKYQGIETAHEVLLDPAAVREDLASFLSWYWGEVFSDVWASEGVPLMDRVGVEKALLAAVGPMQYLEYCHPDLKLTQESVIVGRGSDSFAYDLSEVRQVDVFLSAFTGGRLMFNLIDGHLTVCKGVSLAQARTTAVPGGILNFLRAINGDTKLKILSELYKEPKTTKELSDILGIAPSTVSVHLKMMRDAELIYPQRVQNLVYNRFLFENYQAFLVYLMRYFE